MRAPSSDLPVGLDALRAYQAHAGRWPTDFRLPQRNAIYRTYLRALNRAVEDGRYVEPPVTPPKSQDDWRSQAFQQAVIANVASRLQIRDFEAERTHRHAAPLRAPGIGASKIETRTVSPRRPRPHRLIRPPSHMWANEMRTVQRAAGSVLEGSTSFPRAGRVNRGVLDFADLLVDGWKYNGEQGGDDAGDVVDVRELHPAIHARSRLLRLTNA